MRQLIFLFFSLFITAPLAKPLESLRAQVGSEIISQIDLENFKTQLQQGLVPSSLLFNSLYSKSQLLNSENDRLNFLIERIMILQMIPPEFQKVNEDLLNQSLKKIRGKSSQAHFLSRLKKAGLNLSSFKKFLEEDLQIELFLSQNVLSKISVFDQDIESYYFKKYNEALFKNFEYEFLSLSFGEDKKTLVLKRLGAEKKEALELMAETLGLDSKNSKLKGTEIGAEIKKELDKLSVSQISPLLLIGGSYYLFQLKWKSPLISPQEEKIKAEIEQKLYQQKTKQELEQWLAQKKSEIFIKKISS